MMKALLSAVSTSLSRRLLNRSSAQRNCVTTATCRGSGVCAAHHENARSKTIDIIDVSHHKIMATNSHSFHACHPRRRLMGTAAHQKDEEEDDDNDDVEVEVEAANTRCSGNLQIKKVNPYQWDVFAQRPYGWGSIVISSNLMDTKNQPNPKATSCSHAIQTDWNEHILMDLPAQFLNHSCDPNIGVAKELNEGGSYDFIALRDIEEGEEIRFDYETTEYEVGAFADCQCGADICRGTIKGYKYNKDVILEKYGGKNIAGYLTEEC